MPDPRRRPARGDRPGARGRQRRPAGAARPTRAVDRPGRAGRPRPATASPRPVPVAARPRPRLTGRAVVLVLVVAVLGVSYASSLRAYLQQRSHIESLQHTIDERRAQISELEREQERWRDPEYVRTQARERLGYVMPGETPYVVLEDGDPLEPGSTLTDPSTIDPRTPPAWWDDTWSSVKLAGDPPAKADPPPARLVPAHEGDDG